MRGLNFSEWGSSFCGYGPSFGHGSWVLGWIFPVLFWALIAYLGYNIIRSLFFTKTVGQSDSAHELLRNRFAAGEINEQEFTTQKAVLNKR